VAGEENEDFYDTVDSLAKQAQTWLMVKRDHNLDGMKDPFANSFQNIKKTYRPLSKFASQYKSWTLKSFIVKSKDDVR